MTELPPPVLLENGSYENWRSQIQMWQITTTMEPKRQALAVRAKLTGKVREAALKLDAADLNNDSGMSFLIDTLDKDFRKAPKKSDKIKKWDVPCSSANAGAKGNNDNGQNPSTDISNLSAAEKARQRAAELSSKLAAEGKYQTHTQPLPQKSIAPITNKPIAAVGPRLINPQVILPSNIVQQTQGDPEVKKMDNGNSIAEFNINDVSARPFLTRSSTRELIAQQSGAAVTLRGRFLTEVEKKRMSVMGVIEKPLTYVIQANVAAKVQVAIHKIKTVIRNYENFGSNNNFDNYGLSPANSTNSNQHYVQEKLFVGLDNVSPEFNLKEKLAGENGMNFSFMVQQTGAKVFLRGRGSGYVEANSGRESFEALHIYISHPRQDGLDMARQLCESLIETVKAQHQQWTAQKMIVPSPQTHVVPPYSEELRYPIYSQNNYPQSFTYAPTQQQSPVVPYSVVPPLVHSNAPGTMTGTQPYPSQSTISSNDFRPPDNSHYTPGNMFSEREIHSSGPSSEHRPSSKERYDDDHNNDRRHRSRRSPTNRSPSNERRSRSPEPQKSSRYRDTKSRTSPGRSPNRKETPSGHRDSPITYRESPNRDISPKPIDSSRRHDLSPKGAVGTGWDVTEVPRDRRTHKDAESSVPYPYKRTSMSPPPHRHEYQSRRKDSSPVHTIPYNPVPSQETKKRKFVEEPKKRRKFSEDPKLLEQAKAKEKKPTEDESERRTLSSLQGKGSVPKLQFRSKKISSKSPEDDSKPRSILKMAPPPSIPVMHDKSNGRRNVNISPAGLGSNTKKRTTFKEDKFEPPPPIEKLRSPQASQNPPKALKMGALGSLSMYEGDSDDSD